ncbi:MAG: hypothetical protein IPP90_12420 [Gemmatimonadaceae bacterium]|nr:hypothetical protein [Gemmatimonadaceae bacterium]
MLIKAAFECQLESGPVQTHRVSGIQPDTEGCQFCDQGDADGLFYWRHPRVWSRVSIYRGLKVKSGVGPRRWFSSKTNVDPSDWATWKVSTV